MTITREEFKQLYNLFDEADAWYDKHQEVFSDNVCEKLLDPYYKIFDMLGEGIADLVADFHYDGYVVSKWVEPEEDEEEGFVEVLETTSDLDVFYDVWIAG